MRDKNKPDDPFTLDVSDETRQRADEMLAGSKLATFYEKRNLGDDFRKATLVAPRERIGPMNVLLSRREAGQGAGLVVLCEMLLPDIREAEIRYHTPMGDKTLLGRIEAGRPGHREEDRKGDTRISVAWFHPAE